MTYGSDQNKEVSTVSLVPEIVSIRPGSKGQQDEIVIKDGQIQIDDLWTTEALIDRLRSHIIQVKREKKQPDSHRSPSFRYGRKYLDYTVELIQNWTKVEQASPPQNHVFIFHLSDLSRGDDRLVAELIDLSRNPSTISYVLHKVLEWLFGLVSAGWFYQSAAEDIQVRFDA